ncbi:MAG: DUF5995 family protein [Myxococcales bacterium]|nr:DUF5995 family protein [Myxococcales bacterium]
MQDIDHVIQRLDEIVDWARENQRAEGYFAALYRRVTARVRDGIRSGFFDDGPRMERLDVVFARRYLDAFDARQAGRATTQSWEVAFDMAGRYRPIVLQHLLGGMNAHINLDLGIAAASVAPGDQLPALHDDFLKINQVLAALVDSTKDQLARIWPPLKLIDWLSGPVEDAIVNFSMGLARDGAWEFAEQLAPLPEQRWQEPIARRDALMATKVAPLVYNPGWLASTLLLGIRLGERGDVADKLDALVRSAEQGADVQAGAGWTPSGPGAE